MTEEVTGILIDPEAKALSNIKIEYEENEDGEFEYELLRLRDHLGNVYVERVPIFGNYDLWLDEEGLLKPNKYFCLGMQFTPYAGKAMLLPRKEPLAEQLIEAVRPMVVWVDAEPGEQKVDSAAPGVIRLYNDWSLKSGQDTMEVKVTMQGRLHALPLHIVVFFSPYNSPDDFAERFAGRRAVAKNGEIVLFDRTPWWRKDKDELQLAFSKDMAFEMADAMTSIRSVQ